MPIGPAIPPMGGASPSQIACKKVKSMEMKQAKKRRLHWKYELKVDGVLSNSLINVNNLEKNHAKNDACTRKLSRMDAGFLKSRNWRVASSGITVHDGNFQAR